MKRFESKEDVRRFVWKKIEGFAVPPFPLTGRIPNFRGSRKACERLRELEEYNKSATVFSAPDSPLLHARRVVLEDGKNLLAVKPRITGFLLLKGKKFGGQVSIKDVSIKGMIRHGVEIGEAEFKSMGSIDVFIQGCVAIDRKGNRIGKGSGYGDKEYDLLQKYGLLDGCLYVVIAHEVQIFDDLSYLMKEHDVRADIILTPAKIIECEY